MQQTIKKDVLREFQAHHEGLTAEKINAIEQFLSDAVDQVWMAALSEAADELLQEHGIMESTE